LPNKETINECKVAKQTTSFVFRLVIIDDGKPLTNREFLKNNILDKNEAELPQTI
jgi:hypothetical protein